MNTIHICRNSNHLLASGLNIQPSYIPKHIFVSLTPDRNLSLVGWVAQLVELVELRELEVQGSGPDEEETESNLKTVISK
jgi:hypothetical protein